MTQHENNQETPPEISVDVLEKHASQVADIALRLRENSPKEPTPLSIDAAITAAAIIYGNLLRKPKD